jgi:hypothetical protein
VQAQSPREQVIPDEKQQKDKKKNTTKIKNYKSDQF